VAYLISVNLGVRQATDASEVGVTGIDKRPAEGPVSVRAPGPRDTGLGGGLAGDVICDRRHHGGDDQAVYAYAREDLDWWSGELDRTLPGGCFGENLTTSGLDVTGALLGERWRVGDDLVLQVTDPRIPCGTFAAWMARQRWVRTFTDAARPGAYLRVVSPGAIRAGDPVEVVHRPADGMTIGEAFRAVTTEPKLLPRLLTADGVTDSLREKARRRLSR